MQVIERIEDVRAQVDAWRAGGERVALVPTMGNLHEGHLALVDAAREHAERVIASVFVNPTQFGPHEDYEAYPRTLEADRDALASRGAEAVFAPSVTTMYPNGGTLATQVEIPSLTDRFCGIARPGHFTGVATVVTKLLNIVRPDTAVFGRKDYQQLLVIQRLVADLDMPVAIVGAPIVRESDGLAMSSRNNYLTANERRRAPALYEALQTAATRLTGGAPAREVEAEAWRHLAEAGLEPEYFTAADPKTLEPLEGAFSRAVILAAAWLGRARLIDNQELTLDARER